MNSGRTPRYSEPSPDPVAHWSSVRVGWAVSGLIAANLAMASTETATRTGNVSPDHWLVVGTYAALLVWLGRASQINGPRVRSNFGEKVDGARVLAASLTGMFFVLTTLTFQTLTRIAFRPDAPYRSETTGGIEHLPWQSPLRLIIALLILVIVAPIAEEAFFRGVLLTRWTSLFGRRSAVILSAALFAVLHGAWLWAFVLALLMTMLSRKSRTLWASIASHSLINLTTVIWYAARRVFRSWNAIVDERTADVRVLTALMLLSGSATVAMLYVMRQPRHHGNRFRDDPEDAPTSCQ